jgi:7-carboxy-7-deazaguanine synthase
MQVTINEIYPCIVGESLQAGLPATLVRLSGCNLACDYCDSRYACVESGQRRGVEEVASALAASPLPRTLITGGEPMLQEDAVVELAAALLRTGHEVLLETNGTLPLARVPAAVIKVVDVKTPGAQAGVPFLAENYRFLQPHDQLKLVLTGREDYVWAKGFRVPAARAPGQRAVLVRVEPAGPGPACRVAARGPPAGQAARAVPQSAVWGTPGSMRG